MDDEVLKNQDLNEEQGFINQECKAREDEISKLIVYQEGYFKQFCDWPNDQECKDFLNGNE